MITQIFSMMSAKLKIGKLNIQISIKSLTPLYTSLSMKFPIVPAIKNMVIIRPVFLLTKSRINTPTPTRLISRIKK